MAAFDRLVPPRHPRNVGGISIAGTSAAIAGSLLIATCAGFGWAPDLLARAPVSTFFAIAVVELAGFAGCLHDSMLGATVQARYKSPTCGTTTEQARHTCGTEAQLVRGLVWMNNDLVNLSSGFLASMLSVGVASIFM